MLFEKILGNINDIDNRDNYEIEKIIIKSDDLEKKILRVESVNAYGLLIYIKALVNTDATKA